jgi:hypothetical protein
MYTFYIYACKHFFSHDTCTLFAYIHVYLIYIIYTCIIFMFTFFLATRMQKVALHTWFTLLLLTCLLYYYLHVYFTITYMYTLLLLTCILYYYLHVYYNYANCNIHVSNSKVNTDFFWKKTSFFVSNDTEAESVVFVSLVLRWFIQRLSHARLGCIGVCVCVCVWCDKPIESTEIEYTASLVLTQRLSQWFC